MESNYLDSTIVSAKDNKNKKGEITSQSYSTAIPKPILNKLGLQKGQKLYWDIENDTIIITPELPETPSIEAGIEILNDILFTGANDYSNFSIGINNHLRLGSTPEEKIKFLVKEYQQLNDEPQQVRYEKVVLYLLDYPMEPENHQILQEVYNQITQTD